VREQEIEKKKTQPSPLVMGIMNIELSSGLTIALCRIYEDNELFATYVG
jgi:hypothetical protein